MRSTHLFKKKRKNIKKSNETCIFRSEDDTHKSRRVLLYTIFGATHARLKSRCFEVSPRSGREGPPPVNPRDYEYFGDHLPASPVKRAVDFAQGVGGYV